MPDLTYDSLDAIPEGLRDDAKQNGDKFVVTVVPNKKLTEFRDNNIALRQKVDSYEPVISAYRALGDDPAKLSAEVTELRQVAQQVKDGTLKGTGAVKEEVDRRVTEALKQRDTEFAQKDVKLRELSTEASTWKQRYERSVLDQQITNAVVAADSVANPAALPDILSRAASLFVVQPDGSIVPKKGDAIQYGADGVTPMSVNEWLTKLVAEAAYLGKQSSGGGSGGGGAGSVGSKYGMSDADFAKLPAQERIRLARKVGK